MYHYDVFVAYAKPDRDLATRLYEGLQSYRVAIDFKVVPPGGDWMELLPEAISASRMILVLVSEHTPNAQYLKDEIALICDGEERGRPERVVVPVYLKEGLKPPYGLRSKQHIDGFRGVDHILSALQPVLPPPPPPPQVVSHKNILLRYRKQLRQTANDLPAVFRPEQDGAIPVLSHVRVRVGVSTPHGLDRRLEEKRTKIHLLSEVLEIGDHRLWALLGEPGSGKSTLLHDLVLQVLDNPESPYLPLLLRIAELKEGEGLVEAVCRFYGQDCAGLLHAALEEKRALILLDGLDETSGSSGAHAVRRVMTDAEGCPLILSSRTTDYRAPDAAFLSLHIQPLGMTEQAELLSNWLRTVKSSRSVEDRVEEAQQTLRRRRSLQKMAQNPLLLTMICIVLRGGERLPDARAALYDRTLHQLLKGEHRLGEKLVNPAGARRLLGLAALRLHGDGGGGPHSSVIHRSERFLEALPAAQGAFRSWGGAEAFLDRVAAQTGILERRDRGTEGYLFAHRSFQEFLAAEQFCTFWNSNQPEDQQEVTATLHKALESPAEWSEVLALACGRKEEGKSCGMSAEQADALVQRLLTEALPGRSPEELEQKRSELLARVVAEAEGLGTATVMAALQVDRAGSAWEKRKEKIEQLPTLLGEPEKVLDLLHAWRPHTRNGNDLWFIREELWKLARGEWTGPQGVRVEEELRKQAEVEAGRIFAHIAKAELDKAVGMIRWKPVPKGEFVMGSPEDEEGRDDDEGPQHRVEFVCGFDVMDAPVTNGLYECFDPGHRSDRVDFTADGSGIVAEAQEDVPAYYLTWYEAQIFSEWIATDLPGSRLPVEAEWECFCRAGSSSPYHSGHTEADLDRVGWYDNNSGGHPHPVRRKAPNAWGLHDCHGNVWEWCLDEFRDYSKDLLSVDPQDLRSCLTLSRNDAGKNFIPPDAKRAVRGGTWIGNAQWTRSAYRSHGLPGLRYEYIGFRLVRPPKRG